MYIMKKSIETGTINYYALDDKGNEKAFITIGDGKCEGYSIVPEILRMTGSIEGIQLLLNWIVRRLKGPIVSRLRSKILWEYGFMYSNGQWIWETEEQTEKYPLQPYEVWVEGVYDSRPYRLEVRAKNEEEARILINMNFPRVHIGYTKQIAEKGSVASGS